MISDEMMMSRKQIAINNTARPAMTQYQESQGVLTTTHSP